MTSLNALRQPEVYPRSAAYDPQWMVDHCMGPNPLCLLTFALITGRIVDPDNRTPARE